MSAVPEAKLAREAEIAYQMVCMSTDYDCWHDDGEPVSVAMVMANMQSNAENAKRFAASVLDELSRKEHEEQVLAKHLEGGSMHVVSTHVHGRSREAMEKMEWLFPGYFEGPSK